MIQFSSVSKQFNGVTVLKDLSFKIGEGEIVGFLGPNGAGKTTTMRALTGVLPVTTGQVRIDGKDPLEETQVKEKIGFLPENNPLYEDMTVEEWLQFWSEVKHEGAISKPEIIEAAKMAGLVDVYHRFISELSKGYRQRVGLAQAILAKPDILVLDEPTEGLDPNQRNDIHTLIKEIGKKRTVIISSHVLAEITKMCSRVMILHRGTIVADGTPDELSAQMSGSQVVSALISGKAILSGLKKIKGVTEVTEESGGRGKPNMYVLSSEGSKDLRLEVFEMAKKQKWDLYELSQKQVGLEDVFVSLTT